MNNAGKPEKPAQKTTPARQAKTPAEAGTASAKPVLLPGGNPQIAKGDGDAPVQAYIPAVPGSKNNLGSNSRFCGTALTPIPPGDSKNAETRYFHIYWGEALDEVLLADWVKQASTLPGEKM